MSFVEPITLQVIADSVGISKLGTDAAKVLAPDVEYRLREIIQEATKFQRHSKRATLSVEDISQALRLRNAQPVYGFANSNKDAARYLRAAGHSDLYFLEDREAPFDKVIGKGLPRAPVEVALLSHWLIVNGTQPAIPENAPLSRPRAKKRQRAAAADRPSATGKTPAAASTQKPAAEDEAADGTVVRAPVKHVLSQELQLYFHRVSALLRGKEARPTDGQPGDGTDTQQLHRAVLASLSSDPGLAPVVPYLVQVIGEGVAGGLRHTSRLHLLLGTVRALAANPHLQLVPYLHQLLPAVLTCLVAKRIGETPTADHWAVRDTAARLVRVICTKYGDPLYNIQPRISKTLLKAFNDRSKPLTTHYGAVVGLAALGPRTARLLLLPHLEQYLGWLQPHIDAQELLLDNANFEEFVAQDGEKVPLLQRVLKQAEARRCLSVLQSAVAGAMRFSIIDWLEHNAAAGQMISSGPKLLLKGSKLRLPQKQPPQKQEKQEAAKQKQGAEAMDTSSEEPSTDGAQPADGPKVPEGAAEPDGNLQKAAASQPSESQGQHQPSAEAAPNGHSEPMVSLPLDRRKSDAAAQSTLKDAWKEDSDLGPMLQRLIELFGDSILPWVPCQPVQQVFI